MDGDRIRTSRKQSDGLRQMLQLFPESSSSNKSARDQHKSLLLKKAAPSIQSSRQAASDFSVNLLEKYLKAQPAGSISTNHSVKQKQLNLKPSYSAQDLTNAHRAVQRPATARDMPKREESSSRNKEQLTRPKQKSDLSRFFNLNSNEQLYSKQKKALLSIESQLQNLKKFIRENGISTHTEDSSKENITNESSDPADAVEKLARQHWRDQERKAEAGYKKYAEEQKAKRPWRQLVKPNLKMPRMPGLGGAKKAEEQSRTLSQSRSTSQPRDANNYIKGRKVSPEMINVRTSPDFRYGTREERKSGLELIDRQRKIVSALEREVSKSRLQVERRDRILSDSSSEDRYTRRKAARAQKLTMQQERRPAVEPAIMQEKVITPASAVAAKAQQPQADMPTGEFVITFNQMKLQPNSTKNSRRSRMDGLQRRRSGTPQPFENDSSQQHEVYSILKRPVSLPILKTRSPSPALGRKVVQFSQEITSRKTSRQRGTISTEQRSAQSSSQQRKKSAKVDRLVRESLKKQKQDQVERMHEHRKRRFINEQRALRNKERQEEIRFSNLIDVEASRERRRQQEEAEQESRQETRFRPASAFELARQKSPILQRRKELMEKYSYHQLQPNSRSKSPQVASRSPRQRSSPTKKRQQQYLTHRGPPVKKAFETVIERSQSRSKSDKERAAGPQQKSKRGQRLEKLVAKQRQKRIALEQLRRDQQENERSRIASNLAKLENDIAKITQKPDSKVSQKDRDFGQRRVQLRGIKETVEPTITKLKPQKPRSAKVSRSKSRPKKANMNKQAAIADNQVKKQAAIKDVPKLGMKSLHQLALSLLDLTEAQIKTQRQQRLLQQSRSNSGDRSRSRSKDRRPQVSPERQVPHAMHLAPKRMYLKQSQSEVLYQAPPVQIQKHLVQNQTRMRSPPAIEQNKKVTAELNYGVVAPLSSIEGPPEPISTSGMFERSEIQNKSRVAKQQKGDVADFERAQLRVKKNDSTHQRLIKLLSGGDNGVKLLGLFVESVQRIQRWWRAKRRARLAAAAKQSKDASLMISSQAIDYSHLQELPPIPSHRLNIASERPGNASLSANALRVSQILKSSSPSVLSSINRPAVLEVKKSVDHDSLAIDQSEVLQAPRVTEDKDESHGTHRLFETSIQSYEALIANKDQQIEEPPEVREDIMEQTVTSNIDMQQFDLGSLEDVGSPRDIYKDFSVALPTEDEDEILKKSPKIEQEELKIEQVSLLRSNNLDMFNELSVNLATGSQKEEEVDDVVANSSPRIDNLVDLERPDLEVFQAGGDLNSSVSLEQRKSQVNTPVELAGPVSGRTIQDSARPSQLDSERVSQQVSVMSPSPFRQATRQDELNEEDVKEDRLISSSEQERPSSDKKDIKESSDNDSKAVQLNRPDLSSIETLERRKSDQMPRTFASWRLAQRRKSHQPTATRSDYEEKKARASREISRIMSAKAEKDKQMSSSEKVSPRKITRELSEDALAARIEAEAVVSPFKISQAAATSHQSSEKVEEQKAPSQIPADYTDKNADLPRKISEDLSSKSQRNSRNKSSSDLAKRMSERQARVSRSDSLKQIVQHSRSQSSSSNQSSSHLLMSSRSLRAFFLQAHSQLSSYDDEETSKEDVVDFPLQVSATQTANRANQSDVQGNGLTEIKEEPAEEEDRPSAVIESRKQRITLSRTLPLKHYLPGSAEEMNNKKGLSKTQKLLLSDKRQYDEPFKTAISVRSVKIGDELIKKINSKPSSSRPSEVEEIVLDGDQEEVEKRREFAEKIEKELANEYIDKELEDMLDSSLLTKRKAADDKKPPPAEVNEEVPAQISERQAQLQKELDELQQEQGNNKQSNQLIAGIDTSMETMESYIEDIFTQIRERGPQFLNAFLTPIYKDPLDQLAVLRQAKKQLDLNGSLGSFGHNLLEPPSHLNESMLCILNMHLYLTLEKERENVIKEAIEHIKHQSEEEINEEELAEMIIEADHIHNKAIFDAVNEAMNLVRPYGIQGEPPPWSVARPRRNGFMLNSLQNNIESVMYTLERVLAQVKAQVLAWSSIRAGAIGSFDQRAQSNELQDLLQDQERWRSIELIIQDEIHMQTRYMLDACDNGAMSKVQQLWAEPGENFQTQVKHELGEFVFDFLVEETVGVLNKLQK